MKTIHKYKLSITAIQTILIPGNGTILYIDNQGEEVFIWCEIETENDPQARAFEIFETGSEIHQYQKEERVYIGTVKTKRYPHIYHIYERIQ